MNISKLIDKGEQAYKKRNYDYAITVLLEAVSFAPNNRKARELLRKAELKKHEASYPSPGAVAIFGLRGIRDHRGGWPGGGPSGFRGLLHLPRSAAGRRRLRIGYHAMRERARPSEA